MKNIYYNIDEQKYYYCFVIITVSVRTSCKKYQDSL